jgi:hypothetical protein
MDITSNTKNTAAFYGQAVVSFGIALVSVVIGIVYLPVGSWVRAFLGLGTMYLVTSSFVLAKCVRDAQESSGLAQRLDQARVDKILAEHDPFGPGAMPH